MKNCPNCGTPNPPGNKKCIFCSFLLPKSVKPDTSSINNAPKGQPNNLYFEVMIGKFPGKNFPLFNPEMIIGRSDHETGDVDIDLTEQDDMETVSRRHLRCVCKEGRVFIEDLSSTNGTYINEPGRIESRREYEVKPGDVIALGSRIALKLRKGAE